MLSCKAVATNSLKKTFVLDVWFGCDCVYCKIKHLSNIDEMQRVSKKKYAKGFKSRGNILGQSASKC